MWRTATTIEAVCLIKILFVFVYVVFKFSRGFLAIRCEHYHRQYILQTFRLFFLADNSLTCKQHLSSKTHDYWCYTPLQWLILLDAETGPLPSLGIWSQWGEGVKGCMPRQLVYTLDSKGPKETHPKWRRQVLFPSVTFFIYGLN
jgi:hypothetical protein